MNIQVPSSRNRRALVYGKSFRDFPIVQKQLATKRTKYSDPSWLIVPYAVASLVIVGYTLL